MDKRIVSFMTGVSKPHKKRICIVFMCMVVIAALGILNPLMQREILDNGIMAGDLTHVIRLTWIIVAISVLGKIIQFIQFTNYEFINRQITHNLIKKVVDHSISLKLSYHYDNNFVKVINNVYSDMGNITNILNASLLQAVVGLFRILGGIIGLVLIDWRLTLFILTIIPLEILTSRFLALRQQKNVKKSMIINEKFAIWFGETFNCIEVIKLWNLQKKRSDEFDILRKDIMEIERKMEYINKYSELANELWNMISTHGLHLLGAILILRQDLTIGGLFAFTAYTVYIMQSITLLTDISYSLSTTIPAFERFLKYFDNEVEKQEGLSILAENNKIEKLSFENVIFGYSKKNNVLNSISFSIHQGEKIAFLGTNGSGKSSIINLLLRFFDPISGKIKINDQSIHDIALNEYRDLFSVMKQDITVFDDSIKNNISIIDDLVEAEIYHYLELATGSEFVKELPDGIDNYVGYNGTKLSGGERQKISLARTLAKKGKILILDEATANFDLKAENRFNHYITQSESYDIVIVISHREDILKKLDKIFVLDQGMIVDSGTFDELITRNNYFNTILTQEKEKLL